MRANKIATLKSSGADENQFIVPNNAPSLGTPFLSLSLSLKWPDPRIKVQAHHLLRHICSCRHRSSDIHEKLAARRAIIQKSRGKHFVGRPQIYATSINVFLVTKARFAPRALCTHLSPWNPVGKFKLPCVSEFRKF